MMDYSTIALLFQWGIVGFFVLFHIIFGFVRGTKKTTYYTFVSILLTVVVLWLISLLTVNFLPRAFLAQMVDRVPLSDDIKTILVSDDVFPIVIALVDFVIKIVAFLILYPIIKWLLTILIFKPIGNKILKKPYKTSKRKPTFVLRNNRFVQYKTKNISLGSRIGGGFIGAFRGFVVGIVLLLPVIIIVSFAGQVNETVTQVSAQLSTTSESNQTTDEILDAIDAFNVNGFTKITSSIKIGEKNLGTALFDFVFTSTIVQNDGTKEKLEFANEFEVYIGAARAAIDLGVLESDFDYTQISKADLPQIRTLLNVGQSKLISLAAPIAANYIVENSDDIELTQSSLEILNDLRKIDYQEDFNQIYVAVANLLEIGNVGELLELIESQDLSQLSQQDTKNLAASFKALSNIELLTLTNVALDFALTQPELQDLVTWEEEAQREEALREYFKNIFADKNYFVGPNGVFGKFSEVIDLIANDENAILILNNILNDPTNNLQYFEPEAVELFANVFTKTLTNPLVLDMLGFGIDYTIYEQFKNEIDPETIGNQLSDRLSGLSNDQWSDEFSNIADIYRKVARFAVDGFLDEGQDYYYIIDELLSEKYISDVKSIINSILVKSVAVNTVLEVATPTLVSAYVEDQELKEVVLEIIDQEEPFKYGQEVSDLLDVAFELRKAISVQEIMTTDFSQLGNVLWTVSLLSSYINEQTYQTNIVDKLTNLQIIKRMNHQVVSYVVETSNLSGYVGEVPENVNFAVDLERILNVAYGASNAIHLEFVQGDITEDSTAEEILDYAKAINLARVLDKPEIFNQLTFNQDDITASLLLNALVYQIQGLAKEDTVSDYIKLSYDLNDQTNAAWVTEINALTGLVHDIIKAYSQDATFVLSIDTIENLSQNYQNLNLDVVTRFNNKTLTEQTFGNIGQSSILSQAIINVIEKQVNQQFNNLDIETEFKVPAEVLLNDKIKSEVITDLIHSVVLTFTDFNRNYHFETVGDLLDIQLNVGQLVAAFNQIDTTTLDQLGSNALLSHIFIDLLEDEGIQNYALNQVNSIQISVSQVALQPFDASFFDFNDLNITELKDLLVGIHQLQIDQNLFSETLNINQVIHYIAELSDAQIHKLFDSNLLSLAVTKVTSSENLLEFGATISQNAFDNFKDSIDGSTQINQHLKTLNIDFDSIFNRIKTITTTHFDEERFDHGEVVTLKNIVKVINDTELDFASLNIKSSQLNDLATSIYDANGYKTISQSRIIKAYLAEALYEQEDLKVWAVEAVELILSMQNIKIDLDPRKVNISKTFLDKNNEFSSSVIADFLVGIAAQDLNAIASNQANSKAFVLGMLDKPFGQDKFDRIDYLYNIKLFEDNLRVALDEGRIDQSITDLANQLIDQYSQTIGFTAYHLAPESIGLRFEHFDRNSVKELIGIVSQLNFEKFTEFGNYQNLEQILRVNESRDLLDQIFETKLLGHVVTQVFKQEVAYKIGADIVNNRFLVPNNLQQIDYELFQVDETLLVAEEYTNIILALYFSGIRSQQNLTPAMLKNLEEVVQLGNYEPLLRIEYVLNANILYTAIDKIIQSDDVKESLALIVNQNTRNLLNQEFVTKNTFDVPNAAKDQNGQLAKSEFISLLKAFNTLELSSFQEASQLVVLNSSGFIRNKDYIGFTENLLESNWVYEITNKVITSPKAHQELAKLAKSVVSRFIGIDHQFVSNDFDITDSKYGLINANGKVSKADLIEFVEAAFVIDPAQIQIDGIQTVFSLFDLINEKNSLDVSNIERILDSKLMYAIADRITNTSYNQTSYRSLYASLFNKLVGVRLNNISIQSNSMLLDLHPDVYENELVKKSELVLFAQALGYVDVSNGYNLNILHNLIGANFDNGQDDLDRMFASLILTGAISNASKDVALLNQVVDFLNTKQSQVELTVDLITPNAEIYENNLIKVSEIRNSLIAAEILGILELDTAHLGIDTFTSALGRNEQAGVDDFDRIFASISLYTVFAKLINSDLLSDQLSSILSDAFDKDIQHVDTKPLFSHLGTTGVEAGLMKKVEIRGIFNALKLTGISGRPNSSNVGLHVILDLIDQNVSGGVDDLDRFLESNYLVYILAKFLESNTVKTLISDGVGFEKEDFDLQGASRTDGYLSRDEVGDIFRGLKLLGIQDLASIGFKVEDLTTLDQNQMDQLLSSTFLYQAISLSAAKNMDGIPNAAYHVLGHNYAGYIKETEIKALIQALDIAGVTDFGSISASSLTVIKLKEIIALESSIINRIISKALIEKLDRENDIPEDSYLSNSELDEFGQKLDLKPSEMLALVETINILGADDVSGLDGLDGSSLSTQALNDMLDLNSPMIDRIISRGVISLGDDTVPLTAYVGGVKGLDILRAELIKLVAVLGDLGVDSVSKVGSIRGEDIQNSTLMVIVDRDSLIANRIISRGIISAGIATDLSYVAGSDKDIRSHEIQKLVEALDKLGIETVAKLKSSLNMSVLQPLSEYDKKLLLESESALPEEERATIIYYIASDIIYDFLESTDEDRTLFTLTFIVSNLS